jgi:NarL family two-component system response regulator LiaR
MQTDLKSSLSALTEREKEVLQLLATGLTYGKIAQRLGVSPETIKMHLKKVYRKLNASNKVEAINHLLK